LATLCAAIANAANDLLRKVTVDALMPRVAIGQDHRIARRVIALRASVSPVVPSDRRYFMARDFP
jgi:hypothetical protein